MKVPQQGKGEVASAGICSQSASSSIVCIGQNIFLGGYQSCAYPNEHPCYMLRSSCLQFCPGLGSAGSVLTVLHASLGCLCPADPSCGFSFLSQTVSLCVTFASSCRTQVLFGRDVTYFLSAYSCKAIQFASLSNALTFLDCFSNSSCAPLRCLYTRAPGLPYIEILVCWSKAEHESSQIYLFSLTVTFAFWASTGDLPCKQLPVELKSQSSAVGVINSLLSLCWTQSVTYLTHLPPCFKIVSKMASA